jgi:hypothetical protein
MQIKIVELATASREESALIPLRHIMVVPERTVTHRLEHNGNALAKIEASRE